MAVEDAQVAHKQAHEACAHTTSRCKCAYCEDGKCLEDNLFTVHGGVASRILCDKEAGASDFKYDCVKGVCDCEYGAKNTALILSSRSRSCSRFMLTPPPPTTTTTTSLWLVHGDDR